jgi:hypothetical protein
MARSSGVRKPNLPKVSMGLGNILAQSGVVADAFGRWPGFALMLMAIVTSAVASGSVAYLGVRGIAHLFGW